jgi:hypothetical protein
MATVTLKDLFEDARRQGMVMSLGPGGQVTMMGPRAVSEALNAAIRGQEDLFITLLCEHLGRGGRQSFVDDAQLEEVAEVSPEAKREAWRAAANCIGQLARPAVASRFGRG